MIWIRSVKVVLADLEFLGECEQQVRAELLFPTIETDKVSDVVGNLLIR